jgi:hypothetical protein
VSVFADDDADRAAENGEAASAGEGRQEDRPIFGVRHGCPPAADGDVRPHRPLASVHMVSW